MVDFNKAYADPSLNKVGAKLKILLTFFFEKCHTFLFKSQKLKIKVLLNEKNRKIVFAYVTEHCAFFGTKINFSYF